MLLHQIEDAVGVLDNIEKVGAGLALRLFIVAGRVKVRRVQRREIARGWFTSLARREIVEGEG